MRIVVNQTPILAAISLLLTGVSLQAQLYHAPHGQASFADAPVELISKYSAYPILSYDFNHDGNLDFLAFTSRSSFYLAYLYGDGKGNFTQGRVSALNLLTNWYVADINNDGIPDFIYIDGFDHFYIAYGNSDGTFQPSVSYPVTLPVLFDATATLSVVAGDLNGDGLLDVIVCGAAGWQVWLNTGSGFAFSDQFLLPNPNTNQFPGLALGDLNGDGNLDLVYATQATVKVFPGVGDGTFGTPSIAPLPNPFPSQWGEIALADWNGDGKLDLLVYGPEANTFYRLAGNGDGTFQPGVRMQSPYGGAQFLVADYNGDGIADIGINAGEYFTVFPGTGGGEFGQPASYPTGWAGGIPAAGAVVGSYRNNGRTDAIVGLYEGFALLFNLGTKLEDAIQLPASGAAAMQEADLNGDGNPDLITVGTDSIQTFLGTGNERKPFTIGPVTSLAGFDEPCFALHIGCFAVGDFTGDGIPDVALASGSIGSQSILVFPGDGRGNFAAPIATPLTLSGVQYLTAADVDGDGKLDLVAGNAVTSILLGKGDGTFEAPVTAVPQGSYSTIRLADLNGDGRLDIVISSNAAFNGVAVALNEGGLTYGAPVSYPGGGYDVVSCDFNGDGIPDLLAVNSLFNYPDVLLGKGDGTFTQFPLQSAVNFNADRLTCGTFTGPSKYAQVAMTSGYASGVEIVKGSATGQPILDPIGWATDLGPTGVVAGKFHGPSSVDDLAVLNSSGTITVLINITK